MFARKPTHRLTVTGVLEGGRVICSGTFATADGKGTHSLLNPVIHLHEIRCAGDVCVGDTIHSFDDGTHEHRPRTKS